MTIMKSPRNLEEIAVSVRSPNGNQTEQRSELNINSGEQEHFYQPLVIPEQYFSLKINKNIGVNHE